MYRDPEFCELPTWYPTMELMAAPSICRLSRKTKEKTFLRLPIGPWALSPLSNIGCDTASRTQESVLTSTGPALGFGCGRAETAWLGFGCSFLDLLAGPGLHSLPASESPNPCAGTSSSSRATTATAKAKMLQKGVAAAAKASRGRTTPAAAEAAARQGNCDINDDKQNCLNQDDEVTTVRLRIFWR